MGGETSVQILQWKGREFPNEESFIGFECFKLASKMEENDLKNMIRRDYGYCICRQIIYKKEGKQIQNKYFPERDSEKMNWIYIGILKDTNCRCTFYEVKKLNDLFIKEIKVLHEENKELKKLIEKGNNEMSKLKSNISNLESKLNNIEKKTDELKEQVKEQINEQIKEQ